MYLALAIVEALQKILMHKKPDCTELWSIKESQVMRSNRIAIFSCQHLPAGRHTCTCVGWAHSAAHSWAAAESMQPLHIILCHLAGWVAFSPSPSPCQSSSSPFPAGTSPAILCCWLDCAPAERPLPSRAPCWLFNAPQRRTHMWTTNATDNGFCQFSFQFLLFIPILSFSRLPSSQLLGKGPTVQQFRITQEVKSLQSQVFGNYAEHFRCSTQGSKMQKEKKYEGKGCS